MTQSVLCAVDISNGDLDSPVLKKAAALADMDGAQLDVVTVLPCRKACNFDPLSGEIGVQI
ncbi:hypothetical protein [Ruegeria sp.]|uniref:hypothetical protein n=1 Tax=Ruegeria sp. TaxID=1879320 RepID=UPI003AFFF260